MAKAESSYGSDPTPTGSANYTGNRFEHRTCSI